MRELRRGGRLVRLGMIVALAGPGSVAALAQQGNPPSNPTENRAAVPSLVRTALPVNPSDPIAVVNGQVITRQQLADECVSRHGTQVLETLIARSLIDQAIREKNLKVSAAEIDAEIARNAAAAGLNREDFLRTLAKERNISPLQYGKYIAFPAVALRKLAEPRVQVTDEDLDKAFEAYYGEKLVCRAIMVDSLNKAKDVWNEVRQNPAGFAKIAQERSIDPDSRALGGLLLQPIVRYAEPLHVSEAAFQQLVDGNPDDTDPDHKPKDGDFTGPIQVSETMWVILQRERLEAAQEVDRSNPETEKPRSRPR